MDYLNNDFGVFNNITSLKSLNQFNPGSDIGYATKSKVIATYA
jgi:hypothetical protein